MHTAGVLVLLFLWVCSSWAAQVTVDFTIPTNSTSNSRMFGTVDPNLLPVGPTLDRYMAGMNLGFIRIVDQDSTLRWMDYTTKNWSESAVQNYFNNITMAYAEVGKQRPAFILDIKRWPSWMYNGTARLPYDLYGDYSKMCADLVKLVNVQLGLNVTYWQPWANLDSGSLYTSNFTALYELYNQSAAAMKAVDPSIKVGPGFGTINSAMMNELIQFSPYVDFAQMHLYFAPNLLSKSNSDIFTSTLMSTKISSFLNSVHGVPLIIDEYALHYNNTYVDSRVINNIGAVWFATIHVIFATTGSVIEGANNYNLNSNYIGLVGNDMKERPSTKIFRWSNNYFVGDVYLSSSTSNLTTLAVRSATNISAVYIINTGASDVTFSFSGWNSGFLLNTLNSTNAFEDEVTYEWTQGTNGMHTIPNYTVWCLYYDPITTPSKLPPITTTSTTTFISSTITTTDSTTSTTTTSSANSTTITTGSTSSTTTTTTASLTSSTTSTPSTTGPAGRRAYIKLSIIIALNDATPFNSTLFTSSIAQAIGFSPSDVNVINTYSPPSPPPSPSSTARSSYASQATTDIVVVFNISADNDAAISKVSSELNKITTALSNAGFAPNATSLAVLELFLIQSTSTLTTGGTSFTTSSGTSNGVTTTATPGTTTTGPASPSTTTSSSSNVSTSSTTGDIVYINGIPCSISNQTCYYGPPKLHSFSKGLSGGLGAVVGVGILIALFAGVTLIVYWESFRRKFGNFYCFVIIFGVLMGYISAITLLPRPTDSLCVAFPWFLGVGFTLVYGCLFIKTWILYRVWRHSMKLKRANVTATTVAKYCGAALAVEIIFLIIWTTVDPPKVHPTKLVDGTWQGHCHSNTDTFWIIFIVVKGLWLFFGATISVLTRHIRAEYNDFKGVANCIFASFIFLVIAIPLALLLEKIPNGVMIIEVIAIMLTFTFSLIFLFFGTWQNVLFPNHDKLELVHSSSAVTMSHVSSTRTHSSHSSNSI